jgi:hypothetical protein
MSDDIDEDAWLEERRGEVSAYLIREGVAHGGLGRGPAWFVAPYVSLWQIESLKAPGSVGWWAICGDHPTDYISASDLDEPREVLHAIGQRWLEVSSFMVRGISHPTISIGSRANAAELGALLRSRGKLLVEWADDEAIWEDAS